MIQPAQIPEIRAQLRAWYSTDFGKEHLAYIGGTQPAAARTRDALAGADLFYISEEMADLVTHAAPSMPDYVLTARDLPSPAGFMYSPRPLFEVELGPIMPEPAGIHAVAWHPVTMTRVEDDGRTMPWEAVELACLLDRDMLPMPRGIAAQHPRLCQFTGTAAWPLNDDLSYELDELPEDRDLSEMRTPLSMLKTAWILMQQPIAAQETVQAIRASRRRIQRLGSEPSPVRVIKLRRASRSFGGTGSPSREYQHQWIVRGHWRQQWYASVQDHRPVWIAPHLQGPEDAPLLGGEKVHHWTR